MTESRAGPALIANSFAISESRAGFAGGGLKLVAGAPAITRSPFERDCRAELRIVRQVGRCDLFALLRPDTGCVLLEDEDRALRFAGGRADDDAAAIDCDGGTEVIAAHESLRGQCSVGGPLPIGATLEDVDGAAAITGRADERDRARQREGGAELCAGRLGGDERACGCPLPIGAAPEHLNAADRGVGSRRCCRLRGRAATAAAAKVLGYGRGPDLSDQQRAALSGEGSCRSRRLRRDPSRPAYRPASRHLR